MSIHVRWEDNLPVPDRLPKRRGGFARILKRLLGIISAKRGDDTYEGTRYERAKEKKMGPDDEVKAVETVEDTSEWEEIEVDVDRPVYERVQRVDRDEPSVTDTSDSMPPTLEAEIVPESKLDVEIMCELGCQRAEGDATSPSARDDISIVAVWCSARSDSESESESEGERPGYGCAARRVEVGDQEEKVEKGLVEDYGYLVHLL